MRRLHFDLILHQVSGCYLDVHNVDPVYQFDIQIVGISHHLILRPFDPLVVNGCDNDFIEGDVHVFD